jgi:5-methylcytosine-specific restriction endonuclease McrA
MESPKPSVYIPHPFIGDHCWYCGDHFTSWNYTKDHFWPKHMGGRLKVPCCKNCNNEKAHLTPLGFIEKLNKMKTKHPAHVKRFDRMINATQTLWDRVKWSI